RGNHGAHGDERRIPAPHGGQGAIQEAQGLEGGFHMMPESEKPKRGEHLRYLLTAYVFESISDAGRRGGCAACAPAGPAGSSASSRRDGRVTLEDGTSGGGSSASPPRR